MKFYKKVLNVVLLFLVAQLLVWFQTYGQFKWQFLADNYWLLILCSMPITYIWLVSTRMGMEAFDNQSWPLRFLGFASGIIIFTICSRFILNEPITIKSIVSICLCISI